MTKQEAIQKAYGGFYKQCNPDNNGWCLAHIDEYYNYERFKEEKLIDIKANKDGDLIFRLKSLSGIENNNGWIKIESEEDLKNISDDLDYHCGLMDKQGKFSQHKKLKSANFIRHESRLGYVNRYQPIQKPQPPIF